MDIYNWINLNIINTQFAPVVTISFIIDRLHKNKNKNSPPN